MNYLSAVLQNIMEFIIISHELQIQCPDTDLTICIRPYWICDFVVDCPTGWDEQNCTSARPPVSEKKLQFERKKHMGIKLSHGLGASKNVVSPKKVAKSKALKKKATAKIGAKKCSGRARRH